MNNNKGFILLDALCSFMLLSSSIIFFNGMISINSTNTSKINDQIMALNYLRENMYNNYAEVSNGTYKTYTKGESYCALYNNEEVCIVK